MTKIISFLLPFGFAGAAIASGNVVTTPISVQNSGLFPTSGISVVLRSAIVPDLESAITKACGGDSEKFYIRNLDTHLTFKQTATGGQSGYTIRGTVTCEIFE